MKYINTDRNKTASNYGRVEPSFDGSQVTFTVKTASVLAAGQQVPMVSATVRLTTPHEVTPCDPTKCGASVNTAAAISLNLVRGEDPTAMLAEVQRVLGVALTQYYLSDGVLPPATADFSD